MKVNLRSVNNPDRMDGLTIKTKWVEVSSLEEASKVCRDFIEENLLGGGNWAGGTVKVGSKTIAKISYNGRIWPVEK